MEGWTMPAAARLSDNAQISSDAHGCPGCPHPGTGPVVVGSPDTNINGLPAARKDDLGVHAVCCGPNIFQISKGSPTVYVNGKPLARMNDSTKHCGGNGNLIEGSPDVLIDDGADAMGLGSYLMHALSILLAQTAAFAPGQAQQHSDSHDGGDGPGGGDTSPSALQSKQRLPPGDLSRPVTPTQPTQQPTQPTQPTQPAPAAAVTVRIIDEATARVLDGTTPTVVVGERVNLRVGVSRGGAAVAFTNVDWTISGNPLGGYDWGGSAFRQLPAPTTSATQRFEMRFYWVAAGSYTAQVSVEVAGTRYSSVAVTFTVQGPSAPTLTSTTGAVWVGNPPRQTNTWLRFGAPGTSGITFRASVPNLPAAGKIGFIQLIKANHQMGPGATHAQPFDTGTNFILDNGAGLIMRQANGAARGATANLVEVDEPGMVLTADMGGSLRIVEEFQIYLMYRSDAANALWVPLARLDWGWTGEATLSGSTWTLTNSTSTPNPAGTASTVLPAWSDRDSDHNMVFWADPPTRINLSSTMRGAQNEGWLLRGEGFPTAAWRQLRWTTRQTP
jgi:uncharacterized Zn-binding protein involved in type VI secretion